MRDVLVLISFDTLKFITAIKRRVVIKYYQIFGTLVVRQSQEKFQTNDFDPTLVPTVPKWILLSLVITAHKVDNLSMKINIK